MQRELQGCLALYRGLPKVPPEALLMGSSSTSSFRPHIMHYNTPTRPIDASVCRLYPMPMPLLHRSSLAFSTGFVRMSASMSLVCTYAIFTSLRATMVSALAP